jgi:photosystem II stability/assembly factor-like uncharacterized protein
LWLLVFPILVFLPACSDDTGTNPPISGKTAANAGADQTVDVGGTVTLDGSGSTGSSLSYDWLRTYQKGQSAAPAKQTGVMKFSFTLDEPDSLEYELTVTSGTTSDKDTVVVRSNPPTISGISPMAGPADTPVIITGNNFSPTAGQNEVLFNGVAAAITSNAITELVAECPQGAITGEITVKVLATGDRVTGPIFTVGDSPWQVQQLPAAVHWLEGVFFLDTNNGWAVGSDAAGQGLIIHTSDGGVTPQSWEIINLATSRDLTAIHFSDANHGTAVGRGNYIWRTVDGGINWTEQTSIRDSGTFSGDLQDVFFATINKGWAVGSDLALFGVIFYTSDGGQNWNLQAGSGGGNPLANILLGLSFADGTTGMAVGWAASQGIGSIFHTTDTGLNWTDQSDVGFLFNVHMLTRFEAWAVGSTTPPAPAGPLVLHTTDAGQVWNDRTALPGAGTSGLFDVHFVDAVNGTIVGDNGLIFRTTDGGTWTNEIHPAGAVRLLDVHFVTADIGWAVGNDVTQIGAPVILRRQ